jgi:hypothetical protein
MRDHLVTHLLPVELLGQAADGHGRSSRLLISRLLSREPGGATSAKSLIREVTGGGKLGRPSGERSVMEHVTITAACAGDRVEVVGHRVGDSARNGEILEVLGEPAHPHFSVRWEDGHVSLLFAGSDIVISRPAAQS